MTEQVITVGPDTEIAEATKVLLEKHINGLPVVDREGILVGIICRSDLIEQQKQLPVPSFFSLLDGFIPLQSWKHLEREVQKMAAVLVKHAMSADPVSVSPETTVEEVAALMVDHNYHTIPVVEERRLVGVVGKEDVLRTLLPAASPG